MKKVAREWKAERAFLFSTFCLKNNCFQIWKDRLQLAQTMEMPYEEARLHDILSRHLPADDPELPTHRDTARKMFEMLNAQLDLKKE